MPEPQFTSIPLHQMGFAPDLPQQTPGVISDSSQLYPTQKGVRTLPLAVQQIAPEGSAAQAYGAFSSQVADQSWRLFKGTRAHIFQAASPFSSWAEWDNSQNYTMSSGFWSFVQRGNDVYAANGSNLIQKSTAGGQFAALTASVGSVPHPKFLAVVEPGGVGWFLFAANLSTGGSDWASTGVNSDGDWAFSVASLGATRTIAKGAGPITGMIGFNQGIAIFKKEAFFFGQLSGVPFIWNIPPISLQVGTSSNLSILNLGDELVFMGPDNFYIFDGNSLQPIPNELKTWFFENVDSNLLELVQARYDFQRRVVFWHFPLKGGGGVISDWIAWNRFSGRWTHGKLGLWMAYSLNVIKSSVSTDVGPGYLSTAGALMVYPSSAGLETTSSLTTWDVGVGQNLTSVYDLRAHWNSRPPGTQSISSVTKTTSGVVGVTGIGSTAPDSNDSFDLIQTARFQQFSLQWTGDGELDEVGGTFGFGGLQ